MNSADKIYLMAELLGYNVAKTRNQKVTSVLESKEYKDLDKVLWMIRTHQGTDEEVAIAYTNLKTMCDTYFDAIVLDAEVKKLYEKSSKLETVNPYINNQYRKQEMIATLGNLKIPYGKSAIEINEYIVASDAEIPVKTSLLKTHAEVWYQLANDDIEEGLAINKDNFLKLQEAPKFRFPVLLILTKVLFLGFMALLGFVLFNQDNQKVVDFRTTANFDNFELYNILMLASLVLLAGLTFFFSIIWFKNKNYKNLMLKKLNKYQLSYSKIQSQLILKHQEVLESIEKSTNESSFIKMNFKSLGIINNESYKFDQASRNTKILTKKEYVSKHKRQKLLMLLGTLVTVAVVTVTVLMTLEVF